MGLYATVERGPQSAGMYTVHEFRCSKPVLSLAKPRVQLIRQSQATWHSVGRAAWRMVSQFSLGPSSFLCTQCDTKCRVALMEGMPSSSTVFCPRSCPGSSTRRSVRELGSRSHSVAPSMSLGRSRTVVPGSGVQTPPCLQQDLGQQEGQEADGCGDQGQPRTQT